MDRAQAGAGKVLSTAAARLPFLCGEGVCKVKTTGRRGFTLIEMVIVVAIVALLAGILVPVAFNQVDDAEKARAMADIRQISSSLMLFRNDTGVWPIHNTRLLYSDGNAAVSENRFENSSTRHIRSFLRENSPATTGWEGPYMTTFSPDPWGNRYVVEVRGFEASGAPYAWIISAGPDGRFQTGRNDTGLQGDDIGLIMN